MGSRIGGERRSKFVETTSFLAIATALSTTMAWAADVSIGNSVTTPVTTSTANSGAGNVTVTANGSVTVTSPAAVTIDSNNTVTNQGAITNNQESGATGILGQLTTTGGAAQNLTSSILNSKSLIVNGPASTSTLYNTAVFNAGIKLSGLGTFTGNIINDTNGSIAVGGNSSYGIQISAPMIGNLTNDGNISVPFNDGMGIMTTARITGTVTNTGTISAPNANGVGMYIGGGVSGGINIGGTVDGTAKGASIQTGTLPTTDDKGNPVYQVSGKAGVWIASDVSQGLGITGNGFTRAQETPTVPEGQTVRINGTTYIAGQQYVNPDISTAGESVISSQGGGTAFLVGPGGPGGYQNITVGARTDSPYSIVNKGTIISTSSMPRNTDPSKVNPYTNPLGVVTTDPSSAFVNVPGVAATAMSIEGAVVNGTIYRTTLSGGLFNNGGDIDATATNATATGIRIATYGNVSVINNAGDIIVTAADTTLNPTKASPGSLGGDAYGILVDSTSSLNTFINSGNVRVNSQGGGYHAYGIIDQSGTLSTFTNTGAIETVISPYNTTGSTIAVDLSANTAGVNFTNNGYIGGPVRLGSGTNTFSSTNGLQIGNLSFTGGNNSLSFTNSTLTGNITLGGGASTVSISGGSKITGGIVSTGTANLTLSQSQLSITDTQQVRVTNATIGTGSTVTFNLPGTSNGNGVLVAPGNVSIASGVTLTPVFTGILQTPQTYNLVTSGALSLGSSLASYFPTATSFMNTYTVQLNPTNSNVIQLTARRRSAGELNLGPNTSLVYEGAVPALALDSQVATALAAPTTRAGFLAAFNQLMPDTTDATRQAALTNQNQALGVVRRRFAGIADPLKDDADLASLWVQALGTAGSASTGSTDLQPKYSYWGVGMALGADWPVWNGAKAGVNITEMFTSVDRDVSNNSSLLIYSSQLNFYARQDIGRFYVQSIIGGGINQYSDRREIAMTGLRRTATGKWSGYQYGGTVEGGVRLEGGSIQINPYLRAGYLKLHENGYSEKNGGNGINLTRGDLNTDSFRGTIGLDFSKEFKLDYDSKLHTDFRTSYTRDFKNDPITRLTQFSAAGTPFTLTSLPHGPSVFALGFGVGHEDSFSAITLDYEAEFAKNIIGHVLSITLRFRL
jgi:uncharacterized protein with beta-barrel porin domain